VSKISLRLEHSEGIVVQAAATIYAAYIAAGKVAAGQEQQVMRQAISDAVWIAKEADDLIISDKEMS
jgi:hypothetical protein